MKIKLKAVPVILLLSTAVSFAADTNEVIPIPLFGTSSSSAADRRDSVRLDDSHLLVNSPIAAMANEKVTDFQSVDFDSLKTSPSGNTDSEPDQGMGFRGISNFTRIHERFKRPRGDHSGLLQIRVFRNKRPNPIVNNYTTYDSAQPRQMAEHAVQIHDVLVSRSRSYGSTTICCFSIMGEEQGQQYIRKYMTSNIELPQKEIREKASSLGYHVIKSQQAHAEGGLLQYLQERGKNREYLVSMGCSRLHCSECDILLKLAFGKDYHQLTAAKNNTGIIQLNEYAIEEKTYNHFYIPEALKTMIETLANCRLELAGRYVQCHKKETQGFFERILSRTFKRNRPSPIGGS